MGLFGTSPADTEVGESFLILKTLYVEKFDVSLLPYFISVMIIVKN